MATQLAVISSVERLWPHEDGTNVVFGLNLQVAIVAGTDVPADLDWLGPWRWELLQKLEFWAQGTAGPGNLLKPVVGSTAADVLGPRPAVTPDQRGAVIKALERRRDEMHAAGGDAIYFFDPDNHAAAPPPAGFHRQLLATAGTLPGPASHSLNLAACVKIPLTRVVDAYLNATKTDLEHDLKVIAVPHFARQVGANTFTFTPKSVGPSGGSPVYRWDYDTAAAAPVTVTAYTVTVDPILLGDHDEDNRYLKLRSYWVGRLAGGAVPPDPGEDWSVRLADRVADAWNLPRHLLDAVGGLAALPETDFKRLWEATLAALRDRAGLGLLDTADGRGLFRRAADQALPPLSDSGAALVRDARLQSLRAKLRLADRTLALVDWQAQLLTAVPALADKMPAAVTPPTPPRRVTVAWSRAQAAAFPTSVPVTVQRAERPDAADADWQAVPGLTQTLPTAVTPDGGRSVALPLYQATAAVAPGWFRGQANVTGGPVTTAAVPVGPGVADDLAPLARALGALQNDSTLAALVGGAWDQLARTYLLELDAGTASPPAYTDTQLVTDPGNFTNARWVEAGTLDLADGNFWAVTLGRVRVLQTSTPPPTPVWVRDAGYNLEFAAGPVEAPAATLRVGVTLALTGGAPPVRQLKVALDWALAAPLITDATSAAPPILIATQQPHGLANGMQVAIAGVGGNTAANNTAANPAWTITVQDDTHFALNGSTGNSAYTTGGTWKFIVPPVTVPVTLDSNRDDPYTHHLRLVFSRAGGRTRVEVSVDWFKDGPVPSGGWHSAVATDLPGGFSRPRAAVTVRHLPAPGGQALRLEAVPPTVLSASGANFADAVKAWDSGPLDKGADLWGQAGQQFRSALAQLQPRRRLALGQTARQWPVWNFYQVADGAFRKFIGDQVKEYLGGLADQRFGWEGATKATGPYRDFAPDPTGAPSGDLQKRVADALKRFAQHLLDSNQLLPSPAGGTGAEPPIPQEQDADRTATPTPHALNLTVDRPGNFDGQPGTDPDLLRRLSGVGLLIRQAAAHPAVAATPFDGQPWRMPNAANLQALETPDPTRPERSTYALAAERVAGPVRLQYRDDVRQTLLTYDNQPLVARSPLADVARALQYRDKPPEFTSANQVADAASTTPIVITTKDAHRLTTGTQVVVADVGGNTAANNTAANPAWTITVQDDTHFALNGSIGGSAYTGGGTWTTAEQVAPFRYIAPGPAGGEDANVITDASNATPIVIQTQAPHGRVTGMQVVVAGVGGNTAANNTAANPAWTITVQDDTHFALNGSTGNSVYTTGGTWAPAGYPWEQLPSLKFGQFYEVLPFLLGNSGTFPKALADGHPATLQTTGLTGNPDQADDYVRRVRYLRRVAVGSPRLSDNTTWDQATGFPPVRPDVLPLARELGLQALTAAYPARQFFYDAARVAGQLQPGTRWAVTVPRVAVTGRPYLADTDPGNVVQWPLRLGLQGEGATGQPAAVLVAVTRNGATLKAKPDGSTEQSAHLQAGAQDLTGGALDLKWAQDGTALTLSWRRADRGEDWTVAAGWALAAAPELARGYVLTESRDAAGQPVDGPTFGTPRFDSPSTGEQAPPPDEAPLTVLRPVAPDATEGPDLPRFGIRPPATDLNTWARWFDMELFLTHTAAGAQVRQDVWTAYHQRLPVPDQPAPNAPQPRRDLTFDDPAVAGLLFELVPLLVEPATALSPIPPQFVPVRPEMLQDVTSDRIGLPDVQSRPYQVEVIVVPNPDAAPRLVIAGGTVTVRLGQQEIWEVRVHPAVAAGFFTNTATAPGAQRFHSAFGGVDYSQGGTPYKLFAPWRAVFEIATQEVLLLSPVDRQALLPGQALTDPTARDDAARAAAGLGWNALRLAFDGQRVVATLDKLADAQLEPAVKPGATAPVAVTCPGDPRRFRNVAGVQLRRQVWRWRGRPLPPFPFEAAANPDDFPTPADPTDAPQNLMLWDAPGFGDRSGIDMLDEDRQVGYPTPRAELFGESLTADPRALYYRFNPLFTSRYAGLFPQDPPALVAAGYEWSEAPNRAGPDRWQVALTPWRRLVVPCRRTAEVPRPVVRFLVPLTQPDGDPGPAGTPGLLAVLDEPAFAVGGLAEAVEADVVRVDDPWEAQTGVSRPEFGPDPTLRSQGWTKAAKGGTGDAPPDDALPVDVEGPIGHTFDTTADAPLYATSSYFVRPPDVTPIQNDPSLAWYFAKVRLRRLLRPEGMAGYLPLPQSETVVGGQSKDYPVAPGAPGEPRVVTVARLAVPAAGGVAVDLFRASGPAQGTVTLAWVPVDAAAPAPGNHWALSFQGPGLPVAGIAFPAAAVDPGSGAAHADLRFLFQQDEATASLNPPPPPPLHLTISYRLRAPAGVARPGAWRTLLATPWPAATPWPTRLTVRATVAGKDAQLIGPRASTAYVSRFTAPYWVQFLPDSDRLLPPRAADYGVRWQAPNRTQANVAPTLELLAPGTQTAVDPRSVWGLGPLGNWPPPAEGSQAGFVRRLLVTEVVRDVRGQLGQERYLGLYEPAATGTALHSLHRSPALAAFECEEQLSRVRLRVVEFQEDLGLAGAAGRPPWDEAVGPAGQPASGRLADAPARVVGVSPPVTVPAIPIPPPAG